MNRIAKFEKVSKQQFAEAMLNTFGNIFTANIDDVSLPVRATSGSAGYDFVSPISFELAAGESIKVPTGIRVNIREGWWLAIVPRSSLGFKYRMQLDNTVGVVDRIAERITERNFIMLSAKYQEEQNALDGKIDLLNGQISENSERYSNIETWVKLIKQYASPTELDSILLNALVEKITVHEAVKHEDGSREQEVEIFYKFIGKID